MSITANKLLQLTIEGNAADLRLLVTRSNCNYQDPVRGLTLLSWAVTLGHLEVAQLLLSLNASLLAKDRDGFLPIHRAAWSSSKEMCELLLKYGADVNSVNSSRMNMTPLILASMRGETSIVNLLCIHGANVDHQGSDQLSAISLAARCGSQDVVTFLMNAGADCFDARFQADLGAEKTRTIPERERFNEISRVLCQVWARQSQASIK
jgi:ankyrin repeat protein